MALSDAIMSLWHSSNNTLKPGDVVYIHPGSTGITKNDAVSRRQREFWESAYGRVVSEPSGGRVDVQIHSKRRSFEIGMLERINCDCGEE